MKPFDLEKALAGEPVVLRDGHKAIVYYCVPDEIKLDDEGTPETFPLKGMKFDQDGYLLNSSVEWRKDGRFRSSESDSDIVGMWEEPKLTTEEIMEKAFREELILRHPTLPTERRGFRVVGKTVGNDYILQDCDRGEMYFASVFNENIEWIIKD